MHAVLLHSNGACGLINVYKKHIHTRTRTHTHDPTSSTLRTHFSKTHHIDALPPLIVSLCVL